MTLCPEHEAEALQGREWATLEPRYLTPAVRIEAERVDGGGTRRAALGGAWLRVGAIVIVAAVLAGLLSALVCSGVQP